MKPRSRWNHRRLLNLKRTLQNQEEQQIFLVFSIFKTKQGRSKLKGKYFWIFELQLENQKDKVKLQHRNEKQK